MRVKIKNSMITHYDLFAGIGGFSLALDTVFHEEKIKHIFCEWEAFPTAILKKHWPGATYYGDIADLVTDTERTRRERELQNTKGQSRLCDRGGEDQNSTILTGGFPCQPFSHAGRRQGTSDDRYKWPEMFAVIRNVRPDWVIAENVRGLVTWNDGMVLETACADLESEGYEVQPLIIPAVAVGAPHRRDRVWIVANRHNAGSGTPTSSLRPEDGTESSEEWEHSLNRISRQGSFTPNTRQQYTWADDWQEVAFATCHDGVDDGLPRWMDGTAISASRHRKERLKAYGNAIVPQVAMEIFRAMKTNKR